MSTISSTNGSQTGGRGMCSLTSHSQIQGAWLTAAPTNHRHISLQPGQTTNFSRRPQVHQTVQTSETCHCSSIVSYVVQFCSLFKAGSHLLASVPKHNLLLPTLFLQHTLNSLLKGYFHLLSCFLRSPLQYI